MVRRLNISVVIPVFRSEQMLDELYARLSTVLSREVRDFEIILVEDGGGDGSWAKIKSLADSDSRVQGIQLSRNFGQQNALFCGIGASRYEVIVTMDDDLQHPPEEIPVLLDEIQKGYDVVYGVPERRHHPSWRIWPAHAFRWFLKNILRQEDAINLSAFRIFRADFRQAFSDCRGPFVSVDALLSGLTAGFSSVLVRHNERAAGHSNYNFKKLMNLALGLATCYSTKPLRWPLLFGLFLTLLGGTLFATCLLAKLFGLFEAGSVIWLSALLLSLFGIQLSAMGILGEYFSKIYRGLSGYPSFWVKSQTPSPKFSTKPLLFQARDEKITDGRAL